MTGIAIANYYKNTNPKVGTYITADTWNGHRNSSGVNLIASDWNKAQFRAPLAYDIAVNVKVTGRTVQGDGWVRIQIEFVGDDEPSVFAKGWMRIQ